MIKLRPTYSLLIYILCYSFVRAQSISSHYDGCIGPVCQKSTNLCSWPYTFVSTFGQPSCSCCTRPTVCQTSTDLSRWPRTFVPTFGQPPHTAGLGPVLRTKVPCESATKIYLVGCGKDIYQIIEAIKNEGLKAGVQIHFYLFQNGRYKYLGNFITTYRILKNVLRRYNRYYCTSRVYVNQHNDPDVCEYDNTVIMIPESSESKTLVDTGAWNLVEDKIHENPDLKSDGVVNIWNLVKKDSKQVDFEVSAPKQNEMVCTPINIRNKLSNPATRDTIIAQDFPQNTNLNPAFETVTTRANENTKYGNTYNLDNRNNPCYYTAKQTNYVCQPYHQTSRPIVSKYLSLPNLYSSYLSADSQTSKPHILNDVYATTSSPEGYSIQTQQQPSVNNYVPCTQINTALGPTALISNYAINTNPQNINQYIVSKPNTYGDDSKFFTTHPIASSNVFSNLEYKKYSQYDTTRPCHQYILQTPPNIMSQYDYSKPTKSAYLNQYISNITPNNVCPNAKMKYSLELYKPEVKPYDKIKIAPAENIKQVTLTASSTYASTTKLPANYDDKTYGKQIAVPYSPICNFMSLGNSHSPLGKQYVTYYNNEISQSPSVLSNTLQPRVNELKYDSYQSKLPCYIPKKSPFYSCYKYFTKPQIETQVEPLTSRYESELITKPYEELNKYNFVSPTPSATEETLSSKDNVLLYDNKLCTVQSTKYAPLRTPQTSSVVVPFIPTAAKTLPCQILQAKYYGEPSQINPDHYSQVSKGYFSKLPKKSFGTQYSEISYDKMLPLPTSTTTPFSIFTRPKDYLLNQLSSPKYSNLAQSTNFPFIASPTTLSQKVPFGTPQITPCSYALAPQPYIQSFIPALPFYSPLSPTSVFTNPKEYFSQVSSNIHGSFAPPCSALTQDAFPIKYNLEHTETIKTQPIRNTEQYNIYNYDKSPLEAMETTPCSYAYTSEPSVQFSETTSPIYSPLRPTGAYTIAKAYFTQIPSHISSNLVQPSSFAQNSSPLALYKPSSYSMAHILKPTKYTKQPLTCAEKSYSSANYEADTQTTPCSRAIPEFYIQPSEGDLPQYLLLSPTSVYTKPKKYFSQHASYVCEDVPNPSYLATKPCTYSLSQKEPIHNTWDPNIYTKLDAIPSTPYIDTSTSYSLSTKNVSPYYLSSLPTSSIYTKPKESLNQKPSYICSDIIKPSSKVVTPAVTSMTPQLYPEKYFEAPFEATPEPIIQTSIPALPPALPLYSPLRPTSVHSKPKEYLAQAPFYITGSVAQPYNGVTQAASPVTISKPYEYKTQPLKNEAKLYPLRYNTAPLETAQMTQYSYASTPQSYISSSIPASPHYSPLLPTNLYTNSKEYISQFQPYISVSLARPASSPQSASALTFYKPNTYAFAQTEILKPDGYIAGAPQYADNTYSESPFLKAPFSKIPVTSDISYKPISQSYLHPFKTILPQYSPLHSTSIYTKPKEYLSQAPSYTSRSSFQPCRFITHAAALAKVTLPKYNFDQTIINIKPSESTELPITYRAKTIPQNYYDVPLEVTQTAPSSYAPAIQSTQQLLPFHVASAYTEPWEFSSQAPSYISDSVAQPCSFVTKAASPIAVSKPNTYSWAQTKISRPTKPLKNTEQLYSQKYYEAPLKDTQVTPLSYASLTHQSYLQPALPQYSPLHPTSLYTKRKEYISQHPPYICSDVARPSYIGNKPIPLSTLPYNCDLTKTVCIKVPEYTTQPIKYAKHPSTTIHPVSYFEAPSYGILPQKYLSSSSPLTVPTKNYQEYSPMSPTSVYTSPKNYYDNHGDVIKPIDNLKSQPFSLIPSSKPYEYSFTPLENSRLHEHISQPEKYVDYTDSILPQTREEKLHEIVQPILGLKNVKFSVSPKTYSLPSDPYSLQSSFYSPVPTSYSQEYSPSILTSVYTRPKDYYSQLPSYKYKDITITPDSWFTPLPMISSQPCTHGLPSTANKNLKDYTPQLFPKKHYTEPFGITTKAPCSEMQYSVAPRSYFSPTIFSSASSPKLYSPLRPTSIYTRPKQYLSDPLKYISVSAPETTDNVLTLPNIPIQWPHSNYKLTPKVQSLMSALYSKIPYSNILTASDPIPCTQYAILPTTLPSVQAQAFTPLIIKKPTYGSTLFASKPIEYMPEQPLKYTTNTFGAIKSAPYTEVPSYTTSTISYQMPSKPCSVNNTKQVFSGSAKVSPVSFYSKYTSVPSVSPIPTTICNQPYQYLSQFPSYNSKYLTIPNPTTQASNLIYPSYVIVPTTISYSGQPVENLSKSTLPIPTRPYSPKNKLAPTEYATSFNTIDLNQTPVESTRIPCKNYPLKSKDSKIDETPNILPITSPCISYDSPHDKYVPQTFNTNKFTPLSSIPFVSPTTSYVIPSSYSNTNPCHQEPLEYLSKSIKPCLAQSTMLHAKLVEPIMPQYLPQIPFNPYQTSVQVKTAYPCEKYKTLSNFPTIQQYDLASPNIALPKIMKPCSKYLTPYHKIIQTTNSMTTALSRYQMPSKDNYLPLKNVYFDLVQPCIEYSQDFPPASSIVYSAPLYKLVPQIPKICWPIQPIANQALNQYKPDYETPAAYLPTNSEYGKNQPHRVITSQRPLALSSYEYQPSQTLKLYTSSLPCLSIGNTQNSAQYWAQPFGYMPEQSQLLKTMWPPMDGTKLYTPIIPVYNSASYPKMLSSSKPCQTQSKFTTKETPLVPSILPNKYPDKQPVVTNSNQIYTKPVDVDIPKTQPCSVEYVTQVPKTVSETITLYPILSNPVSRIASSISQNPYYQPAPILSRPLKYVQSPLTGEYVPAMPFTPIQSESFSLSKFPTTPCAKYSSFQEYSPLPQSYTSKQHPKDPQNRMWDTMAQSLSPTLSPFLYPCDKTTIPVTTSRYVPQVKWLNAQPCVNNPANSLSWLAKPLTTLYTSKYPATLPVLSTHPSKIYKYPTIPQTPALLPITYTPVQLLPTQLVSSGDLPLYACTTSPEFLPQSVTYTPKTPTYKYGTSNIPTTPSTNTPLTLSAAAPLTTSEHNAPSILKSISSLHTTTPTYQRPTTYVCQTSSKTIDNPSSPALVPYLTAPIVLSADSKSYESSTKPLYDATRLVENNNIVEPAPFPTNYPATIKHPKPKYLGPVLPLHIPPRFDQIYSPVTYTSFKNIPALSLRKQPCTLLPTHLDTNTPSSLPYTQPITPILESNTYQQPSTYKKPAYSEQEILPTLYTPAIAAPTYIKPVNNLMSTSTSMYRPCYKKTIHEIPRSNIRNYNDAYGTSNLPSEKIKLQYTQHEKIKPPTSKQSYQNNINVSPCLSASPDIYGDNIPISSKLSISRPFYKDLKSHNYPPLGQYSENIKPLYSPITNAVQEMFTSNAAPKSLDSRLLPQLAPIYLQEDATPYLTAPYRVDSVISYNIRNTYQPGKYFSQPWTDALSRSEPVSVIYTKPIENKNKNLVSAFPCLAPCYNNERIQWPERNEYTSTEYLQPCSPAQYTTTVDKNVPNDAQDRKYYFSAVTDIQPVYGNTLTQPSIQITSLDNQIPIELSPINKIKGLTSPITSYSTTQKYNTFKVPNAAKFELLMSKATNPTDTVTQASYDVPCSPKNKYETFSSLESTPSNEYYTEPQFYQYVPKLKYSQIKSHTSKYKEPMQFGPGQYPTVSNVEPIGPRTIRPKYDPKSTPNTQYYTAPLHDSSISRTNYDKIPSYSQIKSDTVKYEKPKQLDPVQYPETSYNVPCALKPKYETYSSSISTPSTQYYTAPLHDSSISTTNYDKIPSYSQIKSDTVKYEKPMQFDPVQYPKTSYNVPRAHKPKYETYSSPISTPSTQYYTAPLHGSSIPRDKSYEIPSYSQISSDAFIYEKPTQFGPVQYAASSYIVPCSLKPKYVTSTPIKTPSTQYYTAALHSPSIPITKYYEIPSNSEIPSDALKYEMPSKFGPVQYPASSYNAPCSSEPKHEMSSSLISTPSTKYYKSPLRDSSIPRDKYYEISSYPQISSDALKYKNPPQFGPVHSPATSLTVPCSPKPEYEISSSPICSPSTQYYTATLHDQSAPKYYEIPSKLHIDTLKLNPTASYAQPCSLTPKYETTYSPLNAPTIQYYTMPILGPLASKYENPYQIPSYLQMKSESFKYVKSKQFSPIPCYSEPCSSIPKYEKSYSPLNTLTTRYCYQPKAFYGTDIYQPKTGYDSKKPEEPMPLSLPCAKPDPCYGQFKPTEALPQIIPFSISPKPDFISVGPVTQTASASKDQQSITPWNALPLHQTRTQSKASEIPCQEFNSLGPENGQLSDSTSSQYTYGRKASEEWPWDKYGLYTSRPGSSITPKVYLNLPLIIPDAKLSQSTKSSKALPTSGSDKKLPFYQEPLHGSYFSNQIPSVIPETGYSQAPVQLFKTQPTLSPFSPISTNEGSKLWPCYRPLQNYVESPVNNIAKSRDPCLTSFMPSLPVDQNPSLVAPDSLHVQKVSSDFTPIVAQPETVNISPKQISMYNVVETLPKLNVPCHKQAYPTNLENYALARNNVPFLITNEFNKNQASPVSLYSPVPSIIQQTPSDTLSSPITYVSTKSPQENILQDILAAYSGKVPTYQSVDNYEIFKPITTSTGFVPTLPLYETKPSSSHNSPWSLQSTYNTESARQVPLQLEPCQMQPALNLKEEYQTFDKTNTVWPWYSIETIQGLPSGTASPLTLEYTTEDSMSKPIPFKPELVSYDSNEIAQPQHNVNNVLPFTASSYLKPCPQQELTATGSQYSDNKYKVFTHDKTFKPTYSTLGISPAIFSSYGPYYTPPKTYTMPSSQKIQKPINVISSTLTKSHSYGYYQPWYQAYEANIKAVHNTINAFKPTDTPSTGAILTIPTSICEQQIKPETINVEQISTQFTEINEPSPQPGEVTSAFTKTHENLESWPYSKQWFAKPIEQNSLIDIKPVQSTDLYSIDATKPTLDQYNPIREISTKPCSSFQPHICSSGILETQSTTLYNDVFTMPKALPYEITSPYLNIYNPTTTCTTTNQKDPFSCRFLKSLPESLITRPANLELFQIPSVCQTYVTQPLPVGSKHVDITSDNKYDIIQNKRTPCTGKYEEYIPSTTDLPLSKPHSELKAYPTSSIYTTIKPEFSSSYEYLAKPCYETKFASTQPTWSSEKAHSLPAYSISSKPESYVPISTISMEPCISHPQGTTEDPSQIQYSQALPTAKDTIFKEPCYIKYDAIEPLPYAPTSNTPQLLTYFSDNLVPQNLKSHSTQLPVIAPQPVHNQIESLSNKPCQKALPTQYYSVEPKASIPTSNPRTSYTTNLYQESPVVYNTPTSYSATQYFENNEHDILANKPCQNPWYTKYNTVKPLAYSINSKIVKPCYNVQISQSPIWAQYENIPLGKYNRPWFSNYYPIVSPTYQTSPKYHKAVSTVNTPDIVDGGIIETIPQYTPYTPLPNASVQIQKPVVYIAPCVKPFISWSSKSLPKICTPYEYFDSTKSVPMSNKVSYLETSPDVNSNNLVTSSNLPCEPLQLNPTANKGKAKLKFTPAQYYPWGSNVWWNNNNYGRNYVRLPNYLASTNPSVVTTRPCYNLQGDNQYKSPNAYDYNYKTANTFDNKLKSNWLRPYVRQLEANIHRFDSNIENLKDNVINNKQVSLDLGNAAIAQCVPDSCESVTEIKTSDPYINIKTWRSKVKLLKARLVIDTEDRWVTNFVPVVKACYASDKVENVVKNNITSKFGDAIVVNGYVDMYKPVMFLCNEDYLKLMSGCSNILWMNYDTARYWEIYNSCCNPNLSPPNIYVCRYC